MRSHLTRRTRRFSATLLSLALAGLLAPTAANALPGDPILPEPEPIEFRPPASGFTWDVPERFTQKTDGRLNWRYNESTATYDPAYVRPSTWPVRVNGCRTQADSDNPTWTQNTYTFTTADGQSRSGRTCMLRLNFPKEGSYQTRMRVTTPSGSLLGTWTQTVVVKDLLIVSLGDSYASGEGAAEYDRAAGQDVGDWVDDSCHRSSFAGPAQAARKLEKSDPKTSVTFLSFACTGATINRNTFADVDSFDPWKPGTQPQGSGILGAQRGRESQVSQLKRALRVWTLAASSRRQIDALLLSGGGNDAGFSLLATTCTAHDYCVPATFTPPSGGAKVSLTTLVNQELAALPARYDALARALAPGNLGLDVKRSFITEYPDPGTEVRSDGATVECDEILEDVMWGLGSKIRGGSSAPRWAGQSELGLARNVFLPGLNRALTSAAGRHSWGVVGGISSGFRGHGYCVGANDQDDSRRFVQTAAMSERLQGPSGREHNTGTLHPNKRGWGVIRDRIVATTSGHLAAVTPDRGVNYVF